MQNPLDHKNIKIMELKSYVGIQTLTEKQLSLSLLQISQLWVQFSIYLHLRLLTHS